MKKIYSIKSALAVAFALLANIAVGQNLQVTADGNPVKNGDVIEVKAEVEDYSDLIGSLYLHCTWDPQLMVASQEGETTVNFTLTKIDDYTPFEICWPTQCIVYKGEFATTSGTVGTTPSHIDIHIIAEKTMQNPDVSLAGGMNKVRIDSGSESLEFTLKGLPVEEAAVDGIAAEAKAEYFTLQGVRVAEPQKGQVYIERKGGKVAKRIF